MDAHGGAGAQRRPLELGREALFIQRVAGLVGRCQQRLRNETGVEAGGDTDVIAGERGAERVYCWVLSPAREVVAEGGDQAL